jgi:hypothetical protein
MNIGIRLGYKLVRFESSDWIDSACVCVCVCVSLMLDISVSPKHHFIYAIDQVEDGQIFRTYPFRRYYLRNQS